MCVKFPIFFFFYFLLRLGLRIRIFLLLPGEVRPTGAFLVN